MLDVRTLLGQRQVALACTCLGSLQLQCQQTLNFIFHDDGTLKPSDYKILYQTFPNINIVSRDEADKAILPYLQNYPYIKNYRKEHPLALKLIDITLLAQPGKVQIFCDTDVLFIEAFQFPELTSDTDLIFMKDYRNSYALWPWQLASLHGGLINKLNSGLMMFRPDVMNLALVESALTLINRSKLYSKRDFWVEQTCWAVLAASLNTYSFDIKQISVAQPNQANLTAETVAIHFVSSYRDSLTYYLGWQPQQDTVTKLKTVKASHATIPAMLIAELQRHLPSLTYSR